MATIIYGFSVRSSGALQAGLTPTWSALYKLSDGSSVASPNSVAPITAIGGGLYRIAYDPESANGELYGVIDAGASISSPADRYIDVLLAADSSRATRLDAAISSRSTYAGGDTAGTTTLLGRLTNTRAGLLDNLDATVSSRATAATVGATIIKSGPSRITAFDTGEDGTVGLFVGDRYSLQLQVMIGSDPPGGTGATWTISTTNESTGAAVTTDFSPDIVAEAEGILAYPLQTADTGSEARLRLTVKRVSGSDTRIFGPLILDVRAR